LEQGGEGGDRARRVRASRGLGGIRFMNVRGADDVVSSAVGRASRATACGCQPGLRSCLTSFIQFAEQHGHMTVMHVCWRPSSSSCVSVMACDYQITQPHCWHLRSRGKHHTPDMIQAPPKGRLTSRCLSPLSRLPPRHIRSTARIGSTIHIAGTLCRNANSA
jgi:hypothetical protein